MSQDIVAKTGMWLLMDSSEGVLITARGNEMLAWGYSSPKKNSVFITDQPLRARIFKHLQHDDEPDADQLPMRGLIKLAKEFMQEILLKKELKEI